MNEINNNLQRIRELSVQAANGTNSTEDLQSIQNEIQERLDEIDRVSEQTQFNGVEVLASTQNLAIQVGAHDGERIEINLEEITTTTLGLDALNVTTADFATGTTLEDIDDALQQVDDLRSHLGAIQNRFESTVANLNHTINNLSAARSRIEDADYAVEVSNMTRAQILQQAGTSVLAQANQVPQTVLSLLR